MSLYDTASKGNRLATLQALRDTIAKQIDLSDSGRDVAALSRQLTDVLTQISNLDVEATGDPIDEIAQRRTARGASASTRSLRTKRTS